MHLLRNCFNFTKSIFVMQNQTMREFLSELLATFVFLSFGLGSVAQSVLYENESSIAVSLSFAFGITLSIIIAGNISGTWTFDF